MADKTLIPHQDELVKMQLTAPGDFDHLVATQVLGWTAAMHREEKTRQIGWHLPENYMIWAEAAGFNDAPFRTLSPNHIDRFSPSNKLQSDYEVLLWCRQACSYAAARNWPDVQKHLWDNRTSFINPYAIGDWSLIALLVLRKCGRS